MEAIEIRPYAATDRVAVRRVFAETADAGGPAGGLFEDTELLADLVTSYYTDFEPEHAWVAVRRGVVVGYCTAAGDCRRMRKVFTGRILGPALAVALRRGLFARAGFWRMAARYAMYPSAWRGRPAPPFSAFPANIHVDLLPEGRGCGAGSRLLASALAALDRSGVPGVHASVRLDNAPAVAFFARHGFTLAQRFELVLPGPLGLRRVPGSYWVRKLGGVT